jgi:hypothetical protein
MTRKKFEIEFDKHGNMCVGEPELAARLQWLIVHNGRLVIRLEKKSLEPKENIPRLIACPIGLYRCPPPPNELCPNYYCPEGGLKIVKEPAVEDTWIDISPQASQIRPGNDG